MTKSKMSIMIIITLILVLGLGSYSFAGYFYGTVNWPYGTTFATNSTVPVSGSGLTYEWCTNGATTTLTDFSISKSSGIGSISWGTASVNTALGIWSVSGTVTDTGAGGNYNAHVNNSSYGLITSGYIALQTPTIGVGTITEGGTTYAKGSTVQINGTFKPNDIVVLSGTRAQATSSGGAVLGYATYSIADNGGAGTINWGNVTYPTNTTWRVQGTVTGTPDNGGTHSYKVTTTYNTVQNTEAIVNINLASRYLTNETINHLATYADGEVITISGTRAVAKYSTGAVIGDGTYTVSRVSGPTNGVTWGSVTYSGGNWQVQGTVNNITSIQNYVLRVTITNGTVTSTNDLTFTLYPRLIGDPTSTNGYSINHSNLVLEFSNIGVAGDGVTQYITPDEEQQIRDKVMNKIYINNDKYKSAISFIINNYSYVESADLDLKLNTTSSKGIQLTVDNAKLYKVANGRLTHIQDVSITPGTQNNYKLVLGSAIKNNGAGEYVLRYEGRVLVTPQSNPKNVIIENKAALNFKLSTNQIITEQKNSTKKIFDYTIKVYNGNIILQ